MCRAAWQAFVRSSTGFTGGVKLPVEVAGQLNRIAWPKAVLRTPDFVVYAVDFELAGLRKNLKRILSPDKLAALKAAGLF